MNKLTLGPWLRDGRTVYALNAKNFNRFYFSVMDAHTPESELIAVATLAQAAPDLLEALERLVSDFESEIHNEYDGTSMLSARLAECDYARAAIAKARGEA